jgi:type III secretion system low calcium response chaperone LcrH/SycD
MQDLNQAKNFLTSLVDEFASSKAENGSASKKFSESTIEGLYSFAFRFYKEGKYQEATNFFRFLTLIDTKTVKNWTGLGASLQMLQNYQKALKAYNVALVLGHKCPETAYHMAECHFHLKEVELGLSFLSDALEMGTSDEALLTKIELLKKRWETEVIEEKVS